MITRDDAKFVHRRLVRRGQYLAARLVLCGLQRGIIRLGLSDASAVAERAIIEAGGSVRYAHHGNTAFCRIDREGQQ